MITPGARRLGLLALLAGLSVTAGAAEIAGVRLPERTKLDTCELVLNGAGLRKKAFFKVYVVGLYLRARNASAAGVLALDGPKRISIALLRNIPVHELVTALQNGVRENSSPDEQRSLNGPVAQLAAILLSLGQGNKGDVISFDWLPGRGTLVVVNDQPKGEAIAGENLYRALLKVWLGERPTNAGLKRALLGQDD